jgi:REP element-mobilizing transposase RayT
MPSTHLSLHYHIVFSTKDRFPFIKGEWDDRLHAYLGGTIKTSEGVPLAINGVGDHVHILAGLRATHRLADFVQDVKQTSSRWVHETIGIKNFAWQPGYAAYTVSASNLDVVIKYIANQKEHHRKKSFQEEYVQFLKKSGVKYDEQYLW